MDRDRAKEEIRSRIDCRKYLEKSKSGMYCCPFCKSGTGPKGTGAVKYHEDTNTCHCFSCGKTFDVLDLIQEERGLDFRAALEAAADELRLPLDDLKPGARRSTAAEDFGPAADQSAGPVSDPDTTGPARPRQDFTAYIEKCRERILDPAALSYLQARGISQEAALFCGLGFDPAADPACAPGAMGSEYKPHPCPRIIIPVTRFHYIGRSIDPDTEKGVRKLDNKGASKDDVFDPREVLYSGAGTIFITEGALDAVSIIEAGGQAIGLNSAGNWKTLIAMLKKKPTKATLLLCLDNDEPGKTAARSLAEGLQQLNISYQDVSAEICGSCKDPNEALTTRGRNFFSMTVQAAEAGKEKNTSLYLDTLMQGEIERFREGRGRKTGFANLDKEAGGLYPGLYVIAAISSLGKTSFALQAADQIAAAGTDVIFFSLEQSRLELVSKSLARYTYNTDPVHAATALQIRQGYIDDGTLDAIQDYKRDIQDRLSIVEGNFSCNVSFIREYTRQYMQRTGTKPVIFIDYLQILQGEPDKRQSTKEMIDSTVTELKRISREFDITVFVISSLNRMNYLTPVSFEALKESGSIEYSADVIYGLQLRCINEELFNKESKLKEKRERIRQAKAANPREIELLCLKNRYGISSFSCFFDYYPANDLFRPATDFIDDPPKKRI